MPRKNETAVDEKTLLKVVKRHLEGGESAVSLAKEYGVSRATVYNWIDLVQTKWLHEAEKSGASPQAIETADKRALLAKIRQLENENARLRSKVIALLIKTGEI